MNSEEDDPIQNSRGNFGKLLPIASKRLANECSEATGGSQLPAKQRSEVTGGSQSLVKLLERCATALSVSSAVPGQGRDELPRVHRWLAWPVA